MKNKKKEKGPSIVINKHVLMTIILIVIAFGVGYVLDDFIREGPLTRRLTKEVPPEFGEELPETCPCGCNMDLDTCGCSTAERIKSRTQTSSTEQQPERIVVSIDDDPSKGLDNASVVIIEFSDFQCPFCAKFWREVLPQIEKEYIETGKVKFVYRDYPLGFHQYAQKAAEAAECADEQGKFWEYHDMLFENQNALDITNLKKYAKDLGLDINEFEECLDSGKMAWEVRKDFQDGQSYGVTGTPTFFINGQKLVGVQPFESFKQIIDRELG